MKKGCLASLLILAGICIAVRPAPSVRAEAAGRLQAQDLRVATMPLEPFVMDEGDQLAGFSVDLWDALAGRMGVRYRWVRVGSVEELLAAVQNGQADLGIAGISMTPEREQVVDFTLPIFNAGLRVMTAQRSTPSLPSFLRLIFSPALLRVLALGMLILVVTAHVVWLAERGTNEAIPMAYFPGIWEALWWSLASIATHEYGVLGRSRKRFQRLLAMVIVAIGIILLAQFTASVAATLTVHQLTGSIHGPTDLPGKRIATVRATTGAEYLEGQHITPIEVERIEDAYALLQGGRVDAIVFDAPVLLYHAGTSGKGSVQVVGPTLKDEYYGIALPAGSSLRKPINEALLELMQNGVYAEIHDKWFGGS